MVNNSDKSVWISFVANETKIQIYTYETAPSPGTVAREMYVYNGTCGSLSLVNSILFDYTKFGLRTLYLNGLAPGNSYFVKIIAASTSSYLAASFSKIVTSPPVAPCAPLTPNYSFITQTMPAVAPGSTIIVAASCTLTMGSTPSTQLLQNCKVIMGTGSKIIAPAGIKITGGTRIYSCTGMWQGIDVLAGDLVIDQNSLISDAEIAVNIFGGFAIIQDAIFNRNTKSIVFNSSITSVTPVIPIRNTIFTSRDFNLSSYTMSNPSIPFLKSINTGTGLTYLEGFLQMGLINTPILRAYAGILDNHTYNSPLAIGQIPLGSKNNNIFDNMDFGIISSQTQTTCINNIFQNMPKSNSSIPPSPYTVRGVGIMADGNTSIASNSYTIKVGDLITGAPQNTNTFFNCWRGIYSNNYSNNIISYNSFSSDDIENYTAYERALFLSITPGGNTTFDFNNVSSLLFGSRVFIVPSNFTYTNFSFSNNTFNLGYVTGVGSAGYAMLFNGLASSTTTLSAKINNNTIINVNAAILLRPLGFRTEIKDNTIALLGVGSSGSAGGGVSGIEAYQSNKCTITGNSVTSDYTTGATNKNNYGIYLENSLDCKVHCNNVSNVRQCFVFQGTCTSTIDQVFRYNSMSNARDGLVLLNSGAIGQVGNAISPGGNTWAGFFDNSRSLADLSNFNFGSPTLSYFYCKPGSTTTPPPLTNKVAAGTLNTNKLTPLVASGPDEAFCSGTGGGGGSALAANSPVDVLKDLIVDAAAYPVLEEESEWTNKKSAYEALTFDPAFASINDPDLSAFVADAQNENIATIALTDEMLKQYDYYFAKYLNNGLTPQNLMEQNYKTFTKYYILWSENPAHEFSEIEINDLYTVANQCGNLGGKSVLQAQVFLDYILHQDGNWNNNCPIPASALRKALQKNKEQQIETRLTDDNFDAELSPNPADDKINISNIGTSSLTGYTIIDLIGNQISTKSINNSSKTIEVSQIKNGIYFINLKYENGMVLSKKLTIAHN